MSNIGYAILIAMKCFTSLCCSIICFAIVFCELLLHPVVCGDILYVVRVPSMFHCVLFVSLEFSCFVVLHFATRGDCANHQFKNV